MQKEPESKISSSAASEEGEHKQSRAKLHKLLEFQKEAQAKWASAKMFENDAPEDMSKPKYMVCFKTGTVWYNIIFQLTFICFRPLFLTRT